jgi:hypothetical protein
MNFQPVKRFAFDKSNATAKAKETVVRPAKFRLFPELTN